MHRLSFCCDTGTSIIVQIRLARVRARVRVCIARVVAAAGLVERETQQSRASESPREHLGAEEQPARLKQRPFALPGFAGRQWHGRWLEVRVH